MAADEAKNLNSQKNFEKFGFALVSFLEDDKNLEKPIKKQKTKNKMSDTMDHPSKSWPDIDGKNLEKPKKKQKKTKWQTPWTTLPRAGQT